MKRYDPDKHHVAYRIGRSFGGALLLCFGASFVSLMVMSLVGSFGELSAGGILLAIAFAGTLTVEFGGD